MFTIYRIAFPPEKKPYWTGILFTHKNGDFYAISLTERISAARICKLESHISDSVHSIPYSLLCRGKKLFGIVLTLPYKKKTAGTWVVTNTERPKCPTIGVGGGGRKDPPLCLPWEFVRRRNFCPWTSHGASLLFRQNIYLGLIRHRLHFPCLSMRSGYT